MDRVARRGPLARAPGALKGGHFRNCQHFCRSWRSFVAKHQKIEGGKFLFSEKNLTVPKKTERGPFSLARYSMFRWKKEQPFWLSSLSQMVQFDTINIGRTLEN